MKNLLLKLKMSNIFICFIFVFLFLFSSVSSVNATNFIERESIPENFDVDKMMKLVYERGSTILNLNKSDHTTFYSYPIYKQVENIRSIKVYNIPDSMLNKLSITDCFGNLNSERVKDSVTSMDGSTFEYYLFRFSINDDGTYSLNYSKNLSVSSFLFNSDGFSGDTNYKFTANKTFKVGDTTLFQKPRDPSKMEQAMDPIPGVVIPAIIAIVGLIVFLVGLILCLRILVNYFRRVSMA